MSFKYTIFTLVKNSSLSADLIVIGGGAAGFFAAIQAAEQHPGMHIIILEQGYEVLGKVKISGGGRCNVTHACFEARELVKFYPRGSKELLGVFHRFHCEQTIGWFEEKGINLKTEEDGRVFPVSDSSQTIIDCFLEQAELHQIHIIRQAKVTHVDFGTPHTIHLNNKQLTATHVLMATGSSNTIWQLLQKAGHHIVPPVPSLFTFNIKHELIKGLEGITLNQVSVQLRDSKIQTEGALLITHTGLSGPAILKLSAFAARALHDSHYQFQIDLNWINTATDVALQHLRTAKEEQAKKQAGNFNPFTLPHRFWLKVLECNGIPTHKLVADLNKNDLLNIAQTLTKSVLPVHSKNTNKDEFVTAGGVDLKEVNFKTMESKRLPNVYLAGEILDIDAVTGGFNFQAAWSTGYIAGSSVAAACV